MMGLVPARNAERGCATVSYGQYLYPRHDTGPILGPALGCVPDPRGNVWN
jgi:hypothetical protein